MKSLVIVDAQNDFMPGGSLEVPSGDLIVPVINRLAGHFDIITATQDWHPKDHLSFASNHPGKIPFDKINLNGIEQILWPDHCMQGTPGAMFHHALETNRISAIFRKGMNRNIDSYSGFYDNMRQAGTGLSGYMKDKGVTELYFCGLAADICVYFTIMDAVKEGFSATLIDDASRPLNIESYTAIKKMLAETGVRIINSEDILLG